MTDNRAFSSPWTLSQPYWIVMQCADPACRAALLPALEAAGARPVAGDATFFGLPAGADWAASWNMLASGVKNLAGLAGVRAAVIASETEPSHQEIVFALKPYAELDAIAANLWLARRLSEGGLVSYMQKVIDRRGKLVGYEAFARIEQPDGSTVSGGAIMQASHALRIEYQVDRLMHREAIKNFVESDLVGTVFINFLTGFIHRPEVYLDGLSQAVAQYGMLPRNVALDVPLIDYAQDLAKLKTIASYCRARGFAMALDDVMGTQGLEQLLADIRPSFVKLDAKLTHAMLDTRRQQVVTEIIRLAHAAGATVLAEGVESEALYQAYLAAGVDMFQGYYFGAPERYPPHERKKTATAN